MKQQPIPKLRTVVRGGVRDQLIDGTDADTGDVFRAFVEGQKGRSFRAPYACAVWDKESGRLTPGFEEFARELALGHDLEVAWGNSFPDEPFGKTKAKSWSFHPLIVARVDYFHREKTRIETALRRQTLEAKNITYEWLIERAAENVILGQGGSIVRVDKENQTATVIDGKQDLASSNRALEMLGRERAAFLEQRPKQQAERPYSELEDREIDAELEATRRQLGITVNVVVNGNGHAIADAFRGNATVIDAEPADGRGEGPLLEGARASAPPREDPSGDAAPA